MNRSAEITQRISRSETFKDYERAFSASTESGRPGPDELGNGRPGAGVRHIRPLQTEPLSQNLKKF